ncbi:MAG: glycosyltransferase family 4 protein, partial [Candidatus Bipolaricaulota bacterium]|nr:glycosyltransferase family 4 protein [Candidatus Bipolaricaulota bacterium]
PALSYQFAEELLNRLSEEAELPDILECQDFNAIAYFILQRRLTEESLLTKIPVLIHLHSPMFEINRINQSPRYKFPHYWVGEMEKFCIVAADGLLSPSHFLKRCVCSDLQRSLPIEVIPYPYRFEEFEEALASNYQPTPGDIVYGGRLEIRKGVLPFVKACTRLWDQGHDFRLTLIGGDTEFAPRGTTVRSYLVSKYQRFIKSGHLVITKEPLPQKELYKRYAKAWAVVVPSIWENFPNVCIEAMALGKVVIASTAGGQAEMIESHGRYGLLFDWAQPGDCERVLKQALGMSQEENRAIGARAA